MARLLWPGNCWGAGSERSGGQRVGLGLSNKLTGASWRGLSWGTAGSRHGCSTGTVVVEPGGSRPYSSSCVGLGLLPARSKSSVGLHLQIPNFLARVAMKAAEQHRQEGLQGPQAEDGVSGQPSLGRRSQIRRGAANSCRVELAIQCLQVFISTVCTVVSCFYRASEM